MWRYIWAFAPDTIAVTILLVQVKRISFWRSNALAGDIVREAIERFAVKRVNKDVENGLMEWIHESLLLARIRETVAGASLIALSGTLALATDQKFLRTSYVLIIIWLLLFMLGAGIQKFRKPGRRFARRETIWLFSLFLVFILFNLGLKGLNLVKGYA